MTKFRAAIVGLGFGAEFIPIFQRHPDARHATPSASARRDKLDRDRRRLRRSRSRYTEYADVLKDPDVDFVHINTPIPDHAPHGHRRPRGGQARGLHRAHGDERGRTAKRIVELSQTARGSST